MIASFLLIKVINTIYFFNKSLISAKSSSCVGPFGASGAGAAASSAGGSPRDRRRAG